MGHGLDCYGALAHSSREPRVGDFAPGPAVEKMMQRAAIETMLSRGEAPRGDHDHAGDRYNQLVAVANSVSGMVRPSALAVLRLITSYLVGACTGGVVASRP